MLRFASLGSGSAGNSLVAVTGNTTVLLDCGFSAREIVSRLARLELNAENLSGILVTHEHDDHVGSAFRLSALFRIPVYLTHGTLSASGNPPPDAEICIIDSHTAFDIGDMHILPYPVPHDSREPTQFVLSNGDMRLGVLTDAGISTPHIESMLSGCHALVLECNHDLDMLRKSNYPKSLKERISGRLGHLSNASSAKLLASLDTSRLQHIIAAHLSAQNNSPALAQSSLSTALRCEDSWIGVADQSQGFGWREIR